MYFFNAVLYILSFFAIWFGSGLIIAAIHGVSKKLHISSFSLSFFVLGLLTSIPELAVGLTAIAHHTPEIFVGNLLGGIPVLYLFAIPILAILANGVKLAHKLSREMIFLVLLVTATPAAFTIDGKVTMVEAVVLILLYVLLFIFIEHNQPITTIAKRSQLAARSWSMPTHVLKLLAGVGIVFVSSQFIVNQTTIYSQYFHISPFIISLVVLSLGTNLPEISLGIRSIASGENDIALGDYLGSAAANVILLGGLTIANGGEVISASNFITIFLFIITGVSLFYVFTRNDKKITRLEGFFLLALYGIFSLIEMLR